MIKTQIINKEIYIMKREGKTRFFYETQFLSFEKKEAKRLCSLLRKNKLDCFIVQKI